MLEKIKILIHAQITQGISPHEIALTCGFSFVIGTFPFFGTTTLLCLMIGFFFRLNQPLLHTLNYAMTPIHLLSIPVYVRIGENMLNEPVVSIHPMEMFELFKSDSTKFLKDYGMALLHGTFAWIIIAPWVGVLIYFFVKPVVLKVRNHRIKKVNSKV